MLSSFQKLASRIWNHISISSLAWLSGVAFRLVQGIDHWLGLPDKVSASLLFRATWRNSLRNVPLPSSGPRIWIHGASVGELEDLATFFLNAESFGFRSDQFLVTASSISAQEKLIEWGKQHPFCYVGPLPTDKRTDCQDFLSHLKPDLLVMSHSDIWPNLLRECRRRRIPALWIPRDGTHLSFLQKHYLLPLCQRLGLRQTPTRTALPMKKSFFLGNPRIDRILERIKTAQKNGVDVLEGHQLQKQKGRMRVLLGSFWTSDAEELRNALDLLTAETRERFDWVCIPHEVHDATEVGRIQILLPQVRVIAINGILLEAFEHFDLAFIGGAYHGALHSVLEPALWGKPVVCGPELRKQPEAGWLRERGLLRTAATPSDLATLFNLLCQDSNLSQWQEQAEKTRQELAAQRGGSQRLAQEVQKLLKLCQDLSPCQDLSSMEKSKT